MFERLQQKWKVGGWRLLLIFCTFALGGSLCGRAAKWILDAAEKERDWAWALLYPLLVTLLWPIAVLLVSIPLGQFSFFRNYLKRVGRRIGLGKRRDAE